MKIQAIQRRPTGAHVPDGNRGFALVVTLSLMILLTVIAVGLLTLSSISLRSSSNSAAQQQAQANARLAMMLALGDLQKNLGPDQRISARAETLAKDTRVAAAISPNTPKSWWVGVSNSDGVTPVEAGQPVVWLVSGLTNGSIDGTLNNPVDMIAGGSLDLAQHSGGQPIQAGRVAVTDAQNKVTGSCAWFVDDDGMKARLATTDPKVDNAASPTLGGGLLPGSYPLDKLNNMPSGAGDAALVAKLNSPRDLALIGASKAVTREKFFSYTTRSQGVLSDVRKGGLKKDLTIAFERPGVFTNVFPSSDPSKYLLVDSEKTKSGGPAGELAEGYINWGIFRDFYNIKKYIHGSAANPLLYGSFFEKQDFIGVPSNDFNSGRNGPHEMISAAPGRMKPLFYGKPTYNTCVSGPGDSPNNYAQNPISPILLEMKEKAWVSYASGKIRSNVQVFASHYNPFNIGIDMHSKTENSSSDCGPRILRFPQVLFTAGTLMPARSLGLATKLESQSPFKATIPPGRALVMGFGQQGTIGSETDQGIYSDKIANITNQSVYKDYTAAIPATPINVKLEFVHTDPAMMHGMNEPGGGTSRQHEIAQVFFSPFAWERIPAFPGVSSDRPGKSFVQSLGVADMTDNNAKAIQFSLRTTKEGSSGIRPLVDANIRAQWNNPKWDSPLGLPLLAAYAIGRSGEADSKDLQIAPESGGTRRGFSYWGAGRQAASGYDRVILFDIPRKDLLSLGQLQHASAGLFSYEPTYIVGNSYANPRIPLGAWTADISDTFSTAARGINQWSINGRFNLYDASYLVNEVLWDSYTFTTIPQVADNYGGGDVPANFPGLLERSLFLPNPRYIPYVPVGSAFDAGSLQNTGNTTSGSFFTNAGHLVVDGSFNVNSTSVDAWEAFLSGTTNLPAGKIDSNGRIENVVIPEGVRFPRAALNLGEGKSKSPSVSEEDYWTGFRTLKPDEVRNLAKAIVTEVKDRGPFLTLGAFVNRQLGTGDAAKSGVLQAALDSTVNNDASLNSYQSSASNDATTANTKQGAAFPGQILQGDVLQALAPYMTARSDTFTIRGYGEAKDASGNVTARAYCEAVVQRVPDPVSASTPGSALAELAQPAGPFGRQFKINSFRWLNRNEI